MIDFLITNWLYLVIVLTTISAIVIGYAIYTRKYRKAFPKSQILDQPEKLSVNPKTTQPIDYTKEIIDSPTPNPIETEPQIPEVQSLPVSELPTILPEIPVETNVNEEIEVAEDDDLGEIEDFDKEERKELGRYHIIFRQKDEKWVIKREGSKKIFRSLETQKEAIAYATIKAIVQNTTYVIHKKDGKIRKQNYYKKSDE